MDSIPLRIRIDVDIAQKAQEMAHARGMSLPEAVRMMLTKAVQLGDFSIEKERAQQRQLEEASRPPPYFEYDDSQWNSMKGVLEAELALALVNQYIAVRTVGMQALAEQDPPDAERIGQLGLERDRARQILATLDPSDVKSVRSIIDEFAPPVEDGQADEGGRT